MKIKPTLGILLVIVACSGASCPNQQKTTFNTIASLEQTVDAAYKSYLDLVIQGKISTNSVPSVGLKYNTFQSAIRMGIVMTTLSTNAPPNSAYMNMGMDVLTAINSAKGEMK